MCVCPVTLEAQKTSWIERAKSHFRKFYFLFKKYFFMWTIFKVFIEFVTVLLLFYVFLGGFLAMKHVGPQLPNQGSNVHPLHWKVKF